MKLALILLCCFTSSVSFADSCVEQKNCFPNLNKASADLSDALVKMEQNIPIDYDVTLKSWHNELARAFEEVDNNIIIYPIDYQGYKLTNFTDNFSQYFNLDTISRTPSYPSFSYRKSLHATPSNSNYELTIGNNSDRVEFQNTNDTFCQKRYKNTCDDVLKDLALSVNTYKIKNAIVTIDKMLPLLKFQNTQWANFYNKSRSQTFTDLMLQTYIDKDKLRQSNFVPPSEKQYFFLHPNIVIENVNDALDGQQTNEALAIEWLGINWWQKCPIAISVACGVSVVSLYSDRSVVNDVGHGVMLHFANKYSIGVTNHDGSNGIFITADLLKAFENQNERLQTWKTKVNTLLDQ
ncbi:hypothetical protein [Agitococcus lubricus]|uniref:Uncharacterized protein n=1 Tax=Agitococcus lubricus TaxID=1077255 RepID=A0A2T5ISB3_9GAMM|nr:hypothetical protein [Agitococcus lubricus]PTQ86729.1 hypothetical protein C8N29_1338 [Agitococcus lubricus]